jgi:hypothetical protein
LILRLLPDRYAIAKLPDRGRWPQLPEGEGIVSITVTDQEISIVCLEAVVPADAEVDPGWRVLYAAGPMAFEVTGVIAGLTSPLAAAGVPVLVISTFDGDLLLVWDGDLARSIAILVADGKHRVVS